MEKIVIKKMSVNIVLLLISIIAMFNIAATIIVTAILRGYIHTTGTEKFYMYMECVSLLISALELIIFAILVHRIFVKRIQSLKKAMTQVASGNLNVIMPHKNGYELKELVRSFNQMTAKLKVNEFLSSEFTKNISHEFKTPLKVMRGYSEQIYKESSDKLIKNSAEIIISAVDRLSKLWKALLEISALNNTTRIRKKNIFSLAIQIRTILQSTQILWEEKQRELNLELQEFQLISNEKFCYRIWQNLIDNSIQFSSQGGTITITVKYNY